MLIKLLNKWLNVLVKHRKMQLKSINIKQNLKQDNNKDQKERMELWKHCVSKEIFMILKLKQMLKLLKLNFKFLKLKLNKKSLMLMFKQ